MPSATRNKLPYPAAGVKSKHAEFDNEIVIQICLHLGAGYDTSAQARSPARSLYAIWEFALTWGLARLGIRAGDHARSFGNSRSFGSAVWDLGIRAGSRAGWRSGKFGNSRSLAGIGAHTRAHTHTHTHTRAIRRAHTRARERRDENLNAPKFHGHEFLKLKFFEARKKLRNAETKIAPKIAGNFCLKNRSRDTPKNWFLHSRQKFGSMDTDRGKPPRQNQGENPK